MIFQNTYLECMKCGYRTDLLKERNFSCPKCGNLYDVIHNIPRLPIQEWQDLFDSRKYSPRWNSGVWRFKEWIMPELPDKDIVSLGEGIVPIVPAGPHLKEWIGKDIDVWLILEGKSLTGSFKDFGMTVLVSVAKNVGVKAVICASTGDTSSSVAAYCSVAGIPCAVLMPKGKITPEQLLLTELYDAKIILLPGNFDECMDVVQKFNIYLANSKNPCRIEGHQATVFLTTQFFGWELPAWYVAPIGNGSDCSSLGKGLRLMKKLGFKAKSRILGCQSQAANPLYLSWRRAGARKATIESWETTYRAIEVGETIATAARIGNPVSHKKVIREVITSKGSMVEVSEEKIREGVLVCAKDGHFVCPQSGMAVAGTRYAAQIGLIEPGERVVIVCTADGIKFTKPFMDIKGDVIEAPDCRTETVAEILRIK